MVCFIFIIVSDLMPSPNILLSIYTLIILLFITICYFIYLKNIIDKSKNQFINNIGKSYPKIVKKYKIIFLV